MGRAGIFSTAGQSQQRTRTVALRRSGRSVRRGGFILEMTMRSWGPYTGCHGTHLDILLSYYILRARQLNHVLCTCYTLSAKCPSSSPCFLVQTLFLRFFPSVDCFLAMWRFPFSLDDLKIPKLTSLLLLPSHTTAGNPRAGQGFCLTALAPSSLQWNPR